MIEPIIIGNATLYNMDCMEYMATLPDKAFDLAIVDPPYFEKVGKEIFPGAAISTTGVKRNRFESQNWEIPNQDYFDELLRVSQHQIIWGYNYYKIMNLGSGRIIWDKKNDDSSFSKCEIAYCSLHNSVQIFRHLWNGMLQENMKNKETRIHTTQKPVALYEWILTKYGVTGQKILDTHSGSGSSSVAFNNLGFKIVAIEKDEKHFNNSIARINAATAQERLFA